MKNAFGLDLPQIRKIATESEVKQTLYGMLIDVLTYLDISPTKANLIVSQCLSAAANYSELEKYEAQTHQILESENIVQKIPEKLCARANLVYNEIKHYLLSGKVLDYGCGDGQVAEFIVKNSNCTAMLTDVYEHAHVKQTGLAFKLFAQGETAPFEAEKFDNVLALTVFHHSSDPLASIKDVCRLTKSGGRVLVVESVYGVDGAELTAQMQKKLVGYLSLTGEQQRRVNIFFDHFYNRVLHYSKDITTKVNVPFNFNTPDNWKQLFTQHGLEQEKIIHLGLDQPTAPEYHTLHVLRKYRV
jgi:SAM-dependent methyltransferase